jgi:hypothetical protein
MDAKAPSTNKEHRMANVKVFVGAGIGRLHLADGTVATPNANGEVTVDAKHAADLLRAGFAVESGAGPTAARPSVAPPGTSFFDTTLNKPVWRNAAGTGWVDATGLGA